MPGSAYVFTKPAAAWANSTEAGKLAESDTDGTDRYGLSVKVDGTTVMVGANGQSGDRGAAYLYDIQVWADIDGSTEETTSHIVTGLTNNLKHTFRVRAVNDADEGQFAEVFEIPVEAASPPARPRNFTAVQTGAGQVELQWDPSSSPLTVTG